MGNTFPIGPYTSTVTDPFTGRQVTETIDRITFYTAGEEEVTVARIDVATGECELFPDDVPPDDD